MKILYTTLHDPRFPFGGCEQILLEICLAVRERYGAQVACAVNRGSNMIDKMQEAGVPVTILEWNKMKTFQTLQELQKVTREFQPDIIHSFHRYPVFLLETFLKPKAAVIFCEQVLRRDKKLFFCSGDFLTACHETVKKNLVEHYHVPAEKILTIPNAIKRREPNPETLERIRHVYPKTEGVLTGLCLARLDIQKGHIYLIEAVSKLSAECRKKIKIYLAGDGPLKPQLTEEVRRRGLEEQIIFLGHIQEVSEFLCLTDFMILPSLYEGLPLVIPEANSMGRAVLATDIPGNRESIRNQITGYLVSARDAEDLARGIKAFIDSPRKVEEMGRNAYQFWEKEFSFDRMVKSNYDLYETLMKQKARQ